MTVSFASIQSSLPDQPLLTVSNLPYPHLSSGKVREIFDLDDALLIIATDRLSAFDVILPDGIAGKGILLTQISRWWFDQVTDLGLHHLLPSQTSELQARLPNHPELWARSMLVRKLTPLPIEAVVRGYLAGSSWTSYQQSTQLWGYTLPVGLQENEQLPEPLFTPTTKATSGHDAPLTEIQGIELLGKERYEMVKRRSLDLYRRGSDIAARAGLLLADTKFEFGTDDDGNLYLIDEVLTPDSSRYWPAATYQPGKPQQAFDKQFVRDYLESLDWDKTPPGPKLPTSIQNRTRELYLEALQKLLQTDNLPPA